MTNPRCASGILVPLVFSAAISLLVGNLVYVGEWLLGSGSTTTLSIVGSLVGVATCSLSIWVGSRRVSRASGC